MKRIIATLLLTACAAYGAATPIANLAITTDANGRANSWTNLADVKLTNGTSLASLGASSGATGVVVNAFVTQATYNASTRQITILGSSSGGSGSITNIVGSGLVVSNSGGPQVSLTVTNSPLVGGLAADAFVLKSGDTMTGELNSPSIILTNSGFSVGIHQSHSIKFISRTSATPYTNTLHGGLNDAENTNAYWNGGKIWTAFNDGSGSGLDADLLDGLDGTNYARTTVNSGVALYGYKNVFTYDGSSGVNMSEKRTDIRTTNTAADVFDVYAQNNNGTMDNNRGGLTIWNFGAAYTSSYAAGMRSPTLALGLHSSTSANQGVIMFTSARGTNDTQHDFLIWNGSTAGGSKQVLMISAEGDVISSNTITAASFVGNGAGITNIFTIATNGTGNAVTNLTYGGNVITQQRGTISGGGGSSFPLTNNVSAAGFSISNLSEITLTNAARIRYGADTNSWIAPQVGAGIVTNWEIRVNGTSYNMGI